MVQQANLAAGELARVYANLARLDELEALFKELKGRSLVGLASQYCAEAGQTLRAMRNNPGLSFHCGPFALASILAAKDPKDARQKVMTVLMPAKAEKNGFNLQMVWDLSQTLGMGMQIAKRSPGAAVLLPCVVHWKQDRYSALLKEKDGKYQDMDHALGKATWISKDVLDEEESGYFLVPAGALPDGWVAVGTDEAKGVWGKSYTFYWPAPLPPCNSVSSGCQPGCDQGNGSGGSGNGGGDGGNGGGDGSGDGGGGGGSGGDGGNGGGGGGNGGGGGGGGGWGDDAGMPKYNIDLNQIALMVNDKPVGYHPPKGPDVYFKIAYHQYSAEQPGTFLYSNLGFNWCHNWMAYIAYDCVEQGGGTSSGGGATMPYYTFENYRVGTSRWRRRRYYAWDGPAVWSTRGIHPRESFNPGHHAC